MSLYTLKLFGIRYAYLFSFFLATTGAILILLFGHNMTLMPAFIVLTKLGVEGGINLFFIATAELFPTLFTATAFGICNFTLRIVCLAMPYVAEVREPVPMLVCLVMFASGIGFSALLRVDPPTKSLTN